LERKMIKGVLFDFDGTLTRPGALDFPAIKEELGCPADETILEWLEIQPAARRTELMKILEEREEVAAKASLPNKGSVECLSALKQSGILLGILTRNSLKSVTNALLRFDDISIDDFAAVITRDFSLPKPHPDGVHQAARQMGITPSELLVVGDFRFDVMAGKAAGAPTVLLANRGRAVMERGDPAPDFTICNLEEVIDIVGLG
jgi:hydrogenase expression/formation protein HypE